MRYVHAVLRRALADAEAWGVTARNVARLATPPRDGATRTPEHRAWTAKQVAAFLERTAEHRLAALWVVASTTGMRRGEVLGLKWQDIQLDGKTLAVRRFLISVEYEPIFSPPKTKRSRRSIALDDSTVGSLRTHRRSQATERLAIGPAYEDTDLVFCREDGTALHPDRVTKVFKALAAEAGLPLIRFHDLRHTHATLALQAGVHPKVVSERLGHSTVAMTLDTYSHAIPSMQSEAAERLAELVFGANR